MREEKVSIEELKSQLLSLGESNVLLRERLEKEKTKARSYEELLDKYQKMLDESREALKHVQLLYESMQSQWRQRHNNE